MENIIHLPFTADYERCEALLLELCACYSHVRKFEIGRSGEGRALSILEIGSGENKILYVGTHHAMEHITSSLLLKFAEELCQAPPSCCTVYILPLLNPDGVALHLKGGEYARWQANGRGVDLNHNYDAKWQDAKLLEPQYDVIGPCASRFGGERPESEPETSALCRFVRNAGISLALALHTQGEEIYYDFCGNCPPQSILIANAMSEASGYPVSQPEGIASYAGFKDWCIDELGIPAFTIEAGLGVNPLPESDSVAIYERLRKMLHILPELLLIL